MAQNERQMRRIAIFTNFLLRNPKELSWCVRREDLYTRRYQKRLRNLCLNFSEFFSLRSAGENITQKISKIKNIFAIFSLCESGAVQSAPRLDQFAIA
jgi:hypothetical protein